MLTDLVWIKTFADEAAAARAHELLATHGLESIVSEDPGRATYLSLPPLRGFRVGVRADDVRPALELIWGQTAH